MIDKNYQAIIDIIKSVLNKTPLTLPEDIDIKAIYGLAKSHSLLSIVTSGLESTDYFKSLPKDVQNAFISHKMGSIRKSLSFDFERSEIFQKMEENGIAYLPLKGIIMNPLYPEPGMREFADNDIWYDETKQKAMIQIFKDRGYDIESINECHHDTFMKAPFYNFEMHRELVSDEDKLRAIFSYYKNIKSLMIKDDSSEYAYHLNDNDFYVYEIVHGYKHFIHSGNGLRFIMDIYRYNQVKGETLDWGYIKDELSKMDIAKFEEVIRELSIAVFDSNAPLTEEQDKVLNYLLGSGTYGTIQNSVHNQMEEAKGSRIKFIWRRLYPGWYWCKKKHPFFAYTIIFIPLLIIGRIFKALFLKRDKAMKELELSKLNKDRD